MSKNARTLESPAPADIGALLQDVAEAAELLVESFDKIPGGLRDGYVGALSTARAVEIARYVVREFVPQWRGMV